MVALVAPCEWVMFYMDFLQYSVFSNRKDGKSFQFLLPVSESVDKALSYKANHRKWNERIHLTVHNAHIHTCRSMISCLVLAGRHRVCYQMEDHLSSSDVIGMVFKDDKDVSFCDLTTHWTTFMRHKCCTK